MMFRSWYGRNDMIYSEFKIGEKTKEIWAGDLVTECEFLAKLGNGQMLFYDIEYKCFRRVF